MKALFKLNSIIVMLLCMATSAVFAGNTDPTSPAPSKDNILVLKGTIMNDVHAVITTFYYDNVDCAWHKHEVLNVKNKYSMLLNPTADYQIWYQDGAGHTKIIYIKSGEGGIWQSNIHIDFEAETELFACMYQFSPSESFYADYYALEGIDLERSIEVVAEIEEPCMACVMESSIQHE